MQTLTMNRTHRFEPMSSSNVDKRSIFTDCVYEAERFKWIESEKAGRDLGESAIKGWVSKHWWGYLRARWLEHSQGNTFWVELDRGDFGLLRRDFTDHKELLDTIVELLKDVTKISVSFPGPHVVNPLEPVIQILEALDINSRRLIHKFDCVA